MAEEQTAQQSSSQLQSIGAEDDPESRAQRLDLIGRPAAATVLREIVPAVDSFQYCLGGRTQDM
jgi:hypothetical protein